MYKIKAEEIKASEISEVIEEIGNNHNLYEKARRIAQYKNWAIGDAVEAIASHIVICDADFSL